LQKNEYYAILIRVKKEAIEMKAVKAIINAKIVFPNKIKEGCLVFNDKIIGAYDFLPQGFEGEVIDADGGYLCPGLIDVHTHGYMGIEYTDADMEKNLKILRSLPQHGVTGLLPTVMTVKKELMESSFAALEPLIKKEGTGAVVLGINSEGPFINPEKKGAQDENGIQSFDADWILSHKNSIRIITVAPEMPGFEAFAERICQNSSIILSAGHTNATAEDIIRSADLGLKNVTHLFNAMSPLGHRAPGTAGAALTDSRLYCELICDGFHVNSLLFDTVRRLKGDKLCLITDSVRPAGLPDGRYDNGFSYITKTGIQCLLPNGTIAGSVLTMNLAVKNFYESTGCPLWEAVNAASLNPARLLGEDGSIGSIEAGKDSDLVIFDKDFNTVKTFIKGDTVYEH